MRYKKRKSVFPKKKGAYSPHSGPFLVFPPIRQLFFAVSGNTQYSLYPHPTVTQNTHTHRKTPFSQSLFFLFLPIFFLEGFAILMATNAELLAQFRSPNFASHVRKPSELKQGLMTEAEARYEQNDGMCPEDVVRECEEDQASLLDLSHFKLRSVPKRLLNLAHIETLDMRHNGIAELPDSLFSLEHVRKVNFSSNRLTEIPFNIVKWSCLTDLDLSGNLLTELPDEFSFLDELVCAKKKKKQDEKVEIAQLWQHNRGNYTTPTIFQKKQLSITTGAPQPRLQLLHRDPRLIRRVGIV